MNRTDSDVATAVGDANVLHESGGPRFRSISNPATGESIQFTAVPEDGEDLLRFNWHSQPGGAITEHLHPHQEERFLIVSGEAHFTLNGEQRVLAAGEALVVPVGARHSEANRGQAEIVGVVELRPALRSRQMHEAFAGLGTEGKTTSRGAPKNPLQLGATLWHFRRENRVTSPPHWIQRLVIPPLAALARIVGVQGYRTAWDSRIAAAEDGRERERASRKP